MHGYRLVFILWPYTLFKMFSRPTDNNNITIRHMFVRNSRPLCYSYSYRARFVLAFSHNLVTKQTTPQKDSDVFEGMLIHLTKR